MKTSSSDPIITNLTISIEVISQPAIFIEDFFSWYHYPDAMHYLHRLFKLLFRKAKKKKLHNTASNLVFYYENLIKLLEISWVICHQDNDQKGANLYIDFEDQKPLMAVSMYVEQRHADRAFDFFPRDLSEEELLRPYDVFPKMFKHYSLSKWKEQLNNLLHHAIDRFQGDISTDEFNLFWTPRLLGKMISACHLIYVRELCTPVALQKGKDEEQQADQHS